MNTTNSLPRLLALCLIAAFLVTPARATTIKEFYAIPERQQLDFLAERINDLCDKLRSEYDSKGNRKSPELLKKQKELARFTIQLFETRDSAGIRTSYFKLGSLIYSASLDEKDAKRSIDSLILAFAVKQYNEAQIAADTSRAKPSQVTSAASGKSGS